MVIIYSANMVDRLVDCRLRWRWQRAAAIGSDRDGGGGRRWQPVDGGGSEDGGGDSGGRSRWTEAGWWLQRAAADHGRL